MSFKLFKADGSIPIQEIVSDEIFDFYFTAPQFVACLQAQFSVQPLVTIRKYLPGGGESNVYAGIIVTSASNKHADSIMDIKDSVVGVEGVFAWGSSLLQQDALRQNGLSLFRDAKQVITGIYFRSLESSGRVHFDQSEILESVRKREIDFGFVRAEIIAGLEGINATSASYFKRIGSWNATMPGTSTPYPFPVGSKLYPEWALIAYPHVAYETKLAVIRALLRLNRTSPEAVRARYAAWQLASVYQGVVNILDGMQAFRPPAAGAQAGRQCAWYDPVFSDYDAVACPPGAYKVLEAEAVQNCRLANLSCPPKRVCWCRPCRQSSEFEVRLLPLAPAGSAAAPPGDPAPCLKMQVRLIFVPI
jgi:hypothetical protein